jgi:hypothetical protein
VAISSLLLLFIQLCVYIYAKVMRDRLTRWLQLQIWLVRSNSITPSREMKKQVWVFSWVREHHVGIAQLTEHSDQTHYPGRRFPSRTQSSIRGRVRTDTRSVEWRYELERILGVHRNLCIDMDKIRPGAVWCSMDQPTYMESRSRRSTGGRQTLRG